MNILTALRRRFRNEEGATATEYVFLLVFIALVIVGGATFLGTQVNEKFSAAGNGVNSAN